MKRLIDAWVLELKPYVKVLEIGVGTGRFAQPLQNAGFEIVGIDISRKMAAKAKEKDVEQLLLVDARCLPFKTMIFDATISVHVLHLIAEWKKTLQEICRVTRYAMFSLGYGQKDPVREAYGNRLKEYGYERHRPGKSEQQLSELFCPAKSLFVTSYDVYADRSLTNLKERTSSSQWTIPEEVNSKVVDELKREFAGKVSRQDLYLLKWNMKSLKTYCYDLQHSQNQILLVDKKRVRD